MEQSITPRQSLRRLVAAAQVRLARISPPNKTLTPSGTRLAGQLTKVVYEQGTILHFHRKLLPPEDSIEKVPTELSCSTG